MRPFTILLTGPGAGAQPEPTSPTSTATCSGPARRRAAATTPARSERHVAMFLGRIGVALVGEQRQSGGEPGPRVARTDHLVHVAQLGGHVGAGELVPILGQIPRAHGDRV